jgi:hypothetical protein
MSAPKRKPIIDDTPELLDEFDDRAPVGRSIRTLKPPPEIWELVHPVASNQFRPGKVLATRLASRNVLMVLAGLLILVSVTMAFWKFPIVQNVTAMLPKDDVPSKARTTKATQSRAVQPDSRSKVVVTPNPESLNTSIPDVLPDPDVIATSINSRRVVKQSNRKLNQASIERHPVAALATLPTTESSPVRSNRSIDKAQAESSAKSQPKANTAGPDANSPADTKQYAKPKVIPWP